MGEPLTVVGEYDLTELHDRWNAMRDAHTRVKQAAWIGALVTTFTNEELRGPMIKRLSIGDVLTLRQLGVLGPDEGWTG